MFSMRFILILLIPLSGCWHGSEPVAEMNVEVDGASKRYFSYLPPEHGSDHRPTCGWTGGREASVKPDKSLISYDVIKIGCSFDVSDKSRPASKYGLSLQFRKYDGEQF